MKIDWPAPPRDRYSSRLVLRMPILHDLWENPVEITPSYVSHRNRLIDVNLVHTFHAKGRKLLINTFKQNDHVPTMCIFFETKEKAEEAYQVMKGVYYGTTQTQLVSKPSSDMEFGWELLLAVSPMFLIFFYLFSQHLFPLKY